MRKGLSATNIVALVAGIAFLYMPIAVLVSNSFNDSRLVTVWGGWSLRWYRALLGDVDLQRAAYTSLAIAAVSASAATLLGTLAAWTLLRLRLFHARAGLSALIYAPILMPEVISGLSFLLLFVALGIDRGFWTVCIAHATVAMCFVTLIMRARFTQLDPSLEEAAVDLGCPPLRAFALITVPVVWPSIAASWLLAFTLSLDDFVLASFTTGPGATTLPLRIYSDVRLGVKPEINAVCTVMIGVVAVALLAFFALAGREQNREIG